MPTRSSKSKPARSSKRGARAATSDEPRATAARTTKDELIVELEDGRVLHVPLEWFPRLCRATPEERADLRLVGRGVGIHWPRIDEDLHVGALLEPLARAGTLAERDAGTDAR